MFVRDVIPNSNLEVFENLHEQDSKLTVIETRSVWYTPDDCLTSKSREIIFSRRISRSAYNTLQNIFRTNRYQGSKDSSQSLDPASDQCYHRTKRPMRFQRFRRKISFWSFFDIIAVIQLLRICCVIRCSQE